MTWWLLWLTICLAVGMAYSRFTPGSCCGCAGCQIFDSSSSSDWSGAGWTFGSGGGATRLASGGDIAQSTATFAEQSLRFSCSFSTTSLSTVNRVYVRYSGAAYLYAEAVLQIGGNVRIAVGDDTGELASTTAAFGSGFGFDLQCCYETGVLTCTATDHLSVSREVTAYGVTDAGGQYLAFSCDESGVTVIEQQAYKTKQEEVACTPCSAADCSGCDANSTQNAYGLIVSGVAANLCNASDCGSVDGTYVLSRTGQCTWQYGSTTDPIMVCGLRRVAYVEMTVLNPSTVSIQLQWFQTALPATFSASGLGSDCDFASQNVPYSSGPASATCTWSGATCQVTQAA